MKASLIHEGEVYAYSPSTGGAFNPIRRDHFLKATILAKPASGSVRIRIEHPDVHIEDWEVSVKTLQIAGPWDEVPAVEHPFNTDYAPDEEQPEDVKYFNRVKLSFARHAAKQYGEVVDQRNQVDRLASVGIKRRKAHYAGKGGNESASVWGDGTEVKQFERHEVDHLINAILALRDEAPVAYVVSDVETREQNDPPTVIGARMEAYDLDHRERAYEDAAEHPASLLFLGWDKTRPVKVYRLVRDA